MAFKCGCSGRMWASHSVAKPVVSQCPPTNPPSKLQPEKQMYWLQAVRPGQKSAVSGASLGGQSNQSLAGCRDSFGNLWGILRSSAGELAPDSCYVTRGFSLCLAWLQRCDSAHRTKWCLYRSPRWFHIVVGLVLLALILCFSLVTGPLCPLLCKFFTQMGPPGMASSLSCNVTASTLFSLSRSCSLIRGSCFSPWST